MCIGSVIRKLKTALKQPIFLLLLFLITVPASMTLTGSYGTFPQEDLVQDTRNAYELIQHGTIPTHSCVSSFYATNPPGIAYALVPGLIVFPGNPAAAERFGAALMFAGTLLGIYLWLEKRLGFWPTALSMLIFSVGWCGAFYLTSLWPRGHVFFVVWFLYFLTLWVERRKSLWLGAALVVFAASTYWFMELVPLFIVLPVLYFLYKPQLGWKSISIAALLGLLIWSPYIAYENGRDFRDLKALVLRKIYVCYKIDNIVTDKRNHLVDSSEAQKSLPAGTTRIKTRDYKYFWLPTEAWGTVFAENRETEYLGEPGFTFYCTPLGTWCFQSFKTGKIVRMGSDHWLAGTFQIDYPTGAKADVKTTNRIIPFMTKICTFSPVYNFEGRSGLKRLIPCFALLVVALCFAFRKSGVFTDCQVAARFWRLQAFSRRRVSAPIAPDPQKLLWTVLITALILPLLIQCLLLPSFHDLWGNERRFIWMWLTESVLIGAAMGSIRIRGLRVGIPIGIAALFLFGANLQTKQILEESFSYPPGASRDDKDKALDALAAVVKESGKTSVKIGYDINICYWTFFVRPVNGVAKCGIDWDTALLLRHGIINLDDTPEGLSPNDDFRIRDQLHDTTFVDLAHSRWSMTIDGSLPRMRKVVEAGGYEILAPDAKN